MVTQLFHKLWSILAGNKGSVIFDSDEIEAEREFEQAKKRVKLVIKSVSH